MKYSKYNYKYINGEKNAIFNTFSGAIIQITKEQMNRFDDINKLSIKEKNTYKEMGILIDDATDELAIMMFDNSYFSANLPARYRILTTTGCNANCQYCYENRENVISINEEVTNDIVKFIEKTNNRKEVNIEWFGGEPLVNLNAMKNISRQLKKYGHIINASIVTNGILLDSKKIDVLKELCGIEKVQITLDGVEEIYEKVKNVKKGDFRRVINNIKLLAKKDITVHIRMNYNNNFDDLKELIMYLASSIEFNERIFYYVHPIFEKAEYISKEIMDKIINLNDLLVEQKLMKNTDLYKFLYKKTRCFATNYNGFTISPDGKLYNCSHIMNKTGEIGTIKNYSIYNSNRIQFVDLSISDKCKKCILYPACKGGCRAAEMHLAELNQCNIYKSCIDDILDRILNFADKRRELDENNS